MFIRIFCVTYLGGVVYCVYANVHNNASNKVFLKEWDRRIYRG